MFDPTKMPPNTLRWVLAQAENELNAFLCEVIPGNKEVGNWEEMAKSTAEQCRIIASIASESYENEIWLRLAQHYEDAASVEEDAVA